METVKRLGVLYVDDEEINLIAFKASFRRQFHVYTAMSAVEGRKVLEGHEIDVVISDHLMPGMKGIEFLKSIIADYPNPIRMLLTGFADPKAVKGAVNDGYIYSCIYKPWDSDLLPMLIEQAFTNTRKAVSK